MQISTLVEKVCLNGSQPYMDMCMYIIECMSIACLFNNYLCASMYTVHVHVVTVLMFHLSLPLPFLYPLVSFSHTLHTHTLSLSLCLTLCLSHSTISLSLSLSVPLSHYTNSLSLSFIPFLSLTPLSSISQQYGFSSFMQRDISYNIIFKVWQTVY